MILKGVLYSACGPLASVSVTFRARKTTMGGVVQGSDCSFTTDEDGRYSLDIEPGYYTVSWSVHGREETRMGNIVADVDSEMSLPEALKAAPTPVDPSYLEDVLGQVQASLDAVIVARDETVNAADEAQGSAQSAASSAATADGRASDAAGSADSAAASAQAASGHSDDASTAASTAADAADAAESSATSASQSEAAAGASETAAEQYASNAAASAHAASESAGLAQSAVETLQGTVDDLTIKVALNRTLIDALIAGYVPANVFRSGDVGGFYPLTEAYQNVAGTEPAVADGDPVALVVDQSGSGMNASQVTATARPMMRVDSQGSYLEFDLGDDKLTIDALPAGEYSICLPTREGIYHDTVAHAGGAFDIGPLTYTNGPTDLLLALSDGSSCQMVAPPLLIDRALTASEKDILNSYYMNLGAGSPDLYGDDMVLFAETTTASETFNIPAANLGAFNATVDWGDGTTSSITSYGDADLTHTYDSPGVHRIRISGQFGNIVYDNTDDALKVIGYANLGNTGAVYFYAAFRGCLNMRFGLALGNTDTSSVTSFGTFVNGCTSLQTLDVSGWDTSSVTNFGFFAFSCASLQTLDVSGWNTSSAAAFNNFTNNCTSLQTLDVSGWDTSGVTNFGGFAQNCTSLTTLDVSNWDTSSVTILTNFVWRCYALQTLDVSNWDTSSVTNITNFAAYCYELQELDVSNWDTSSVTAGPESFANQCLEIPVLDISNWDTSGMTNFQSFAQNLTCPVVISGGTGTPFADSAATNYTNAFLVSNLTQQNIDEILVAINSANTSNGTFKQTGGAAPSSAGEAAVTAMRSRGWTVTVTGGF